MAGAINDYLVFPILELIRSEINKNNNFTTEQQSDPFDGEPEVTLYRDHPADSDRVTGAKLLYASGYVIQIYLTLGTTDLSTVPTGITADNPEWEYYTKWRLSKVAQQVVSPDGRPLGSFVIGLNYDEKGRLTGTTVDRM